MSDAQNELMQAAIKKAVRIEADCRSLARIKRTHPRADALAQMHTGDADALRTVIEALVTAERRVADMREAAARWHETEARRCRGDCRYPEVDVHLRSAAAIRALPLPDAPEPQGWRDIATAPMDTNLMLGWWEVWPTKIWRTEFAWAGASNSCHPASGANNGWLHGQATHYLAPFQLPPPPFARTAQDSEMPQPGCAPIKSPWGPDDPINSTAQDDAGEVDNG